MLIPEAPGILDLSQHQMRRLCLQGRFKTRRPNRRERAEGVPPNAYVLDGDSVRKERWVRDRLARARQ